MNDIAQRVEGFFDPGGSSAIAAAVIWLEGTLLGTIATTLATIAVASVGFAMLTGRTDWRHGARVVIGCFILLGASSIVGGIRTTVRQTEPAFSGELPKLQPSQALIPPVSPPATQTPTLDPYGAAAVPPR